MRRRHARILGALVASLMPAALPAAIFTVTDTSDAGAGSLRTAITNANATMTLDEIHFNIPGAGPHTISPLTALPIITQPIIIDGYTQSGSSVNTNPVGQGLNTVLKIELEGSQITPATNPILRIDAGGSTVRGLVMNRCVSGCIVFQSGPHTGNTVAGNFLGTNVAGTDIFPQGFGENVGMLGGGQTMTIGGTTPAARNLLAACNAAVDTNGANGGLIQGNLIGLKISGTEALPACGGTSFGLAIGDNASGFTIGGAAPGARNVIAGRSNGVFLRGANHIVQGNLIGTDVTGTVKIGFTTLAMDLHVSTTNNIIGGSGAGEGNVIAGAGSSGMVVAGSGHTIQGNFIGTDPTGTMDLGNGRVGIQVAVAQNSNVTIGGLGPGERNLIAFNGGLQTRSGGIGMSNGTRVTMRGNLIYGNLPPLDFGPGGLAIDLNNDPAGVTRNDFGDGDTGDNNLQNFPNIATAVPEAFAAPGGAGGTRVIGRLDSTPSTTFDLDFYSDDCARFPQVFIQAETYLGSFQVTTNGSGIATFNQLLPVQIPLGALVTATATDPLGNTSELSQRIVLSSGPFLGDAGGGQAIGIQGMQFEPGAAVTVGGVAATNVVVNPNTLSITANTPPLPPGLANDITVTNPSGVAGTLRNGFVSRFVDVPSLNFADQFVARLVKNGLTAGCLGGNFCVNDSVTRAQMAVFLLRGKEGLCYVPAPETGTVFTDVPIGSFAARWIEELADRGITSGCGGGNYCPDAAVTRESMAVFLLVTLEGLGYQPPACTTASFGDVPCSSGFARWIYELVLRGITAGCGGGNYCPLSAVTRGQMAVFLCVTFSLPL